MSLLLHYKKLGIGITLRVDDPRLEDLGMDLQSSARLSAGRGDATEPADLVWRSDSRGGYQIDLRGRPWSQVSMSAVWVYLQSDTLLDDLVRLELSCAALLHAGAVGDSAGNAVAFCGPSGAGKTSLVTACVLRGLGWLSDELLCFRDSNALVVEGFRRNFNLKQRAFHLFPELNECLGLREFAVQDARCRIRFFDPDALKCGPFLEKSRLRGVVLPRYVPQGKDTILKRISSCELVLGLSQELRVVSPRALQWLGTVARELTGYELVYHDARAAANLVFDLLR